jgi:hypothetical protein
METNTSPVETGADFDATDAFEALLTGSADTEHAKTAPETTTDPEAPAAGEETEDDSESTETPEEADEADAEDEDESTDEDEDGLTDPDPLKTKVTLKIGDKDEVLTLDEVKKGYLRQSDYTRKAQALAEDRKVVEGERQQTSQERAEYATLLDALRSKLSEFDSNGGEIDWQRLRAEDPLRYALERDAWRERQDLLTAAAREQERIGAQHHAERETALRSYAQAEKQKALAANPAWSDANVWQRDRNSMLDTGRSLGFSDAELDKASIDSRLLMLLHEASKYRSLMSKKPVARATPTTMSPPASRPTAKTAALKPASEVTRAKQRLAQTGRAEDAATIFERMLK